MAQFSAFSKKKWFVEKWRGAEEVALFVGIAIERLGKAYILGVGQEQFAYWSLAMQGT
jgi:hypothetical protein